LAGKRLNAAGAAKRYRLKGLFHYSHARGRRFKSCCVHQMSQYFQGFRIEYVTGAAICCVSSLPEQARRPDQPAAPTQKTPSPPSRRPRRSRSGPRLVARQGWKEILKSVRHRGNAPAPSLARYGDCDQTQSPRRTIRVARCRRYGRGRDKC
jgi:hypothetical protein